MIFLQMGSKTLIKGSSRDLAFPDGIPVQALTWGKQRPALGMNSGQSNPGADREGTLMVKVQDVDAAGLFQAAASGKGLGTAKLSFLEGAASGATGYQLVLSDVLVSGVVIAGSVIQFTLNFTDSERRFLMKL